MPAIDSRLNELSRLRNRLLELEGQLKEEKKVSARLREQSEKKFRQAAIVDAEIDAENDRFNMHREELYNAIQQDNETTQELISEMKQEEKDLLEEIADFDLIQYDNERLHNKLKDQSAFHRQTITNHTEEQMLKSQKDFDLRMEMEEILRKTIKNVDDAYKQEAVTKMHQEASQAHAENDRIHTEFSIREAKTEALIRQQQQSYEQLMRTKIERDVMALSAKVQEKNIAKWRDQNRIQQGKLQDMAGRLKDLEDEVIALQLAVKSKKQLQRASKKTKSMIVTIDNETEQWRLRAKQLCRRMIKETLNIAEKNRQRDNAKLTQRLDDLTSSIGMSFAGSETNINNNIHTIDTIQEEPSQQINNNSQVSPTSSAEHRRKDSMASAGSTSHVDVIRRLASFNGTGYLDGEQGKDPHLSHGEHKDATDDEPPSNIQLMWKYSAPQLQTISALHHELQRNNTNSNHHHHHNNNHNKMRISSSAPMLQVSLHPWEAAVQDYKSFSMI